MDRTQDRLQRITLHVQGLRMPLAVEPDAEPQYRIAAAELNRLVETYRTKYPDSGHLPTDAYIAMAALDRAYYAVLFRSEAECSSASQKIVDLNCQIESFLALNLADPLSLGL